MNDPREFSTHEEHLLDLLVDGELVEEQRRELLLSLESRPDGWRRCALAFLEAQSWGREMRGLVREPLRSEVGSTGRVAVAHQQRTSWKVRAAYLPLAMAASFLLAFVLGLAVRPAPNDAIDGGVADGSGSVNPLQVAAHSPDDAGSQVSPDPTPPEEQGTGRAGDGRWGTVKLLVNNGPDGTASEVEFPAVESDTLDEAWLTNSPAVIPPELQKVFERLGHQVRQKREYLPLELDDGRQMVVPVDKVEFTPVANRVYQ